MLEPKQIEAIIFQALSALNDELPEAEKVPLREDTVLFGANSPLDSLSLVSVVVDIETALNSENGLEVSLTDDRAMTRELSPFSTVAALRDYISELISS